MQEGREGKKNDGGREIVRLMYTEVVRNTGVSCFLVFFVPFLSFFRSSLSFFFPFFLFFVKSNEFRIVSIR